MRLFVFFFFIVPYFTYAQILEHYPANQVPYIGGYESYYKDIHDIIIEKNIQPCADKSEFYQFSVLVNTDATISFIRDPNQDYFSKNKCAAELARTVATYQTKWNPATVDGIKQPAVATFMIFPDDFFQNNKVDFSPSITYPRYRDFGSDHLEYFRKQLIANIDVRRFRWNDIFTVEAEFIITREGKMKDIILTKKTGLEEFDRMIFYAFKDMKKTWKPATINGIPIDFRFKYQLTAITDPVD